MTTSSKESNLSNPSNSEVGEHWTELAETISVETKATFVDWLDKELEAFEGLFEEFVTQNSLRKSLRR